MLCPSGFHSVLDDLEAQQAIDAALGGGARTLDERGRQECEVHRALGHVVQNLYRMQHGVVVDGDGVVIAALEGPHLRPAAVGILRVKQVLDAALYRGAEGRRFGIAMRGQQCGSDVGQEANLHPGGVVVERGDVMPVGIDGLVEVGVVAKAVEIVGVVQVAGGARAAHHVDVLAPAAIGYLPGDDVARRADRIVAGPPVRRMVEA